MTNNSNQTVWVLGGGANEPGGTGRSGIEAVAPGQTYRGSQDALIVPIGPNAGEVYKTVNFTDATVGPTGQIETDVAPGAGLWDAIRSLAGQPIAGGPVDPTTSPDWQALLDEFCRHNPNAFSCQSCSAPP